MSRLNSIVINEVIVPLEAKQLLRSLVQVVGATCNEVRKSYQAKESFSRLSLVRIVRMCETCCSQSWKK